MYGTYECITRCQEVLAINNELPCLDNNGTVTMVMAQKRECYHGDGSRGTVTMVMAQRERMDIYSDTLASFPGRSQF